MAHQVGKEEVELKQGLERRLGASFNHPGSRAQDFDSFQILSHPVFFVAMASLVLAFFEEPQESSPNRPKQYETAPLCKA